MTIIKLKMDYSRLLSSNLTVVYIATIAFFLPYLANAYIIGGTVGEYPDDYGSQYSYYSIGSVQVSSTGLWGPPDPMLPWSFGNLGYIDLVLKYTGSLSDTFYLGVTDPVGGGGVLDCQSPQKSFEDWGITNQFKKISFPVSGAECNVTLAENGTGYSYYYLTDNGSFSPFDLFVAAVNTPTVGNFAYSRLHSGTPYLITDNITATTTWSGTTPYVIRGNIEIESGVTLTLEPGVVVKFDTATSSNLIIEGVLSAIGAASSSDRIYLTSLKDDAVPAVGDTNNDGAYTVPDSGDWGGLKVNSGGYAELDYVTLRYGGDSSNYDSLIYNNGGVIDITNSTITESADNGIKTSSGTTTILSSDISFNDHGLYLEGGSMSITASSTIHDNSVYGVYNDTVSNMGATNNWWATSTGPYHSSNNPTGGGDTVSDNVNYMAWIGAIHYVNDVNCKVMGKCGSTPSNGVLRWEWGSDPTYESELADAINTWNSVGIVNIVEATSTADLPVVAEDFDDIGWSGGWHPVSGLLLNTYYLDTDTSTQIQHTITHEFGHALGLEHSFPGNIMYLNQTSLIDLGAQDLLDYHRLWD